ncbi:MAG: LD-carboxypeptidase [Lachnospiraceae bacterium]|nr:LD-carboxypeptidase [Lachnospiraceae bacterium]
MRYPEFLKNGGTIGFVAPSFGCNIQPYKDRFDAAINTFKNMGYSIQLGPNCYEGKGVGISNTPTKCAEELMDYYESSENDVLISCGGGELMCETISEVDFLRIKEANPKWFMGYSDNTNFSFLLVTMADTASFYGPNAPAFGMREWHESLMDSFDVLTGKNLIVHNYDKFQIESLIDEEHPFESYNLTEKTSLTGFVPQGMNADIKVQGRLLGGCLDVLSNLVGTRFDYVKEFNEKYKNDGIIWFLEACDIGVLEIRRTLWTMKEAGWFDNVKAFIFGRPIHGEEVMGLNYADAVMEHTLKAFNVPVILDADIGHVAPSMPVINGALSKVSFKDGNLVIDMGIEL